MPAMSPTMEIGGIVEWKVKEGQEFKAGDVLLEVETDKAEIDVEAQDDGVMAKIVAPNGTKDIPVGKTIAYLADPGDDIASLELPKDDEIPANLASSGSVPDPTTTVTAPVEEDSKLKSSKEKNPLIKNSSASLFVPATPNQVFLPSVEILLHKNGISREDALARIQASGPHGRILKGDVLLYLGKISKAEATSTLEYFKKHEHLNLDNIKASPYKPRAPAPASSDSSATESEKSTKTATSSSSAPIPPKQHIMKQSFDLSAIINLRAENKVQPFSVYQFVDEAVHKSTAYALQQHFQKSDYYDPIFDDLVSIPARIERFKVNFKVNYDGNKNLKQKSSGSSLKPSIFDFLTETHAASSPLVQETPTVDLELILNDKVGDAEEKANLFMKKFSEFFVV